MENEKINEHLKEVTNLIFQKKDNFDCVKDEYILRKMQYILKNIDNITEEERLSIINNISILLHRIESITEDDIFLKEHSENLEIIKETLNTIFNHICSNYDRKEYEVKRLLGIIIFEYKDYNLVKLILNNFTEFETEKDIFSVVIDNYINSLVYNLNDVVYYEKIIRLFYETDNCNINSKNRKILRDKISQASIMISSNPNLKTKAKRRIIDEINSFFKKGIDRKNIIDIENINSRYDISEKFPFDNSEIIDEIKLNELNSSGEYIDLTNEYVVSIDSNGTYCFDDAFSFKKDLDGNYVLTIFIADVGNVISFNSKIDLEAYKRGFSIYIPKSYIPMLPDKLSNHYLSLNRLGIKKVFAYRFVFTPSMELKNNDVEIFKALIRVSKNYSYTEVDKIIKNNKKESDFFTSVLEFSEKLTISNNCFDENDNFSKNANKSAFSKVVSKFMILTNYYTALKFYKLDLPFIYCVNDNLVTEQILNCKDLDIFQNEKMEDIMNLINQNYFKSSYSTVNKGHLGFGLDAYCNTTNPIRNYASITTQRLIEQFLIENKINYDSIYFWEDYLQNLVKYLNQRKEINGYYCSEYIKNQFMYRKTKK